MGQAVGARFAVPGPACAFIDRTLRRPQRRDLSSVYIEAGPDKCVYRHSSRDPQKPTMDIELITEELRKAKELIQSVMEDLRAEREKQQRLH